MTDHTVPAPTAAATDESHLPLLREPSEGVPAPIITGEELRRAVAAFTSSAGPVAIDAERASGYRYSQRAYLVQLRRAGAGTALVDPIAHPDLASLNAALTGSVWVVHAASQDLACLAEVGLRPDVLFDTELAGRLLGEERVGLGTMVEQHLGIRLEKGHSAADWSTRPLPHDWLAYAALDVELLLPLRTVLAEHLERAGKTDWAAQEFEAVRLAPPHPPRAEPWRRVSGIHKVRQRRQLAAVRAIWQARDEYAAQRDVAPGRVLPDSALIAAAQAMPTRPADLLGLPVFKGPRQRRQAGRWFAAIDAARRLPDADLPSHTGVGPDPDGPPAIQRWRERDPVAADRLAACRAVVAELGEQHRVLAQNLLASDVVRHLAWAPPVATTTAVGDRLLDLGARAWQVGLSAGPLAAALAGDG